MIKLTRYWDDFWFLVLLVLAFHFITAPFANWMILDWEYGWAIVAFTIIQTGSMISRRIL